MSLNVMSWNIKSGGYVNYDDTTTPPEREVAIHDVITEARSAYQIDSLVLPDAHRWDDTYGGDDGIAQHLGFQAARFVPLDDERLNRDEGKHIGIVLATDQPVHRWQNIDLGNRQAAGVILDVGKYGVQLVGVYLDDLSEATRVKQATALRNSIEQNIPTIITGDFNMLRPRLRDARTSDHVFDKALRMGAPILRCASSVSEIAKTMAELNKRKAYDVMTHDRTFLDADYERSRPTENRAGHMSVDYSFVYRMGLATSEFHVLDAKGASDHNPIVTMLSGKPASASL